VLLDLDHFKSMNDRFGHPFGDRVLQRTGEAVGNAVRAGDAACRYGGEELAVILPGVALADAMKVAERIRSAVAAIELRPRGERVPVAASFGVAAADAEAAGAGDGDGAALVAAADRALYAAKASGRNRVCAAEREALAA
jgi:diguanylate cyclase (GGDEF)-like protein